MPKLHIVYDPNNKIMMDPAAQEMFGHKIAVLDIPENLEYVDIYAIARKLAELLLEQLR